MSESSYRKILKSTSLFGSVQLSNLLISVVRHKLFAVIIGPSGYGVLTFLFSGFDLIRQATGFGLDVSGVKIISEATDEESRSRKASLLVKLSLITGALGTLVFAALSYNLSWWSFGNASQTWIIASISVAVLLRQVIAAQNAVMQGEGKLVYLAKTNVYGNLFGLIFTLPLFFWLGINAILPTILISAVISLLISFFYYNKLRNNKVAFTFSQALREGKPVLYFGAMLSINGLMPVLSNYLVQLYISANGGLTEVGFFNTGQMVINSYVSIIFTAMSMEYYPRLASYNKDRIKEGNAVSQQAIISQLILLPVIIVFLALLPVIIQLLFSEKFLAVVPMLSWSMLAMFFKAVSWSMGYVIIARADSAVFMKTSVIFSSLYVALCILGFQLYGLEGIGFGLLAYYIVHLLSVYIVVKKRYRLIFEKAFYNLFIKGLCICIALVAVNFITNPIYKYAGVIILLVLSLALSYTEVNKRINIKDFIVNFIKKRKHGDKE